MPSGHLLQIASKSLQSPSISMVRLYLKKELSKQKKELDHSLNTGEPI